MTNEKKLPTCPFCLNPVEPDDHWVEADTGEGPAHVACQEREKGGWSWDLGRSARRAIRG